MIAKNARPNDRTIASLLNAIATRAATLPNKNPSTPTPSPLATLKDPQGAPGLESFNIKTRSEAMDLAIKLYASWIEYSPMLTVHPFNALIKVIWKTGSGNLLPTVFPLDRHAELGQWVPSSPDIVSYTTAILASASLPPLEAFEMATRYFDCICKQGLKIDSAALISVLIVMRRGLGSPQNAHRPGRSASKIAFLARIRDALLAASPVPVRTSNVFLDVARALSCHSDVLEYWQQVLLPIIEKEQSFTKSRLSVNEESIAIVMHTLLLQDKPQAVIQLAARLTLQFGMHVSSPTLNMMLSACRRLGDRAQAQKVFGHYVRGGSVEPDACTIHILLQTIIEDRSLEATARDRALRDNLSWLAANHRLLLDSSMQLPGLPKATRKAFALLRGASPASHSPTTKDNSIIK